MDSGVATIFGPPPPTTCLGPWPRGYGDYFFLAGPFSPAGPPQSRGLRGPATPLLVDHKHKDLKGYCLYSHIYVVNVDIGHHRKHEFVINRKKLLLAPTMLIGVLILVLIQV